MRGEPYVTTGAVGLVCRALSRGREEQVDDVLEWHHSPMHSIERFTTDESTDRRLHAIRMLLDRAFDGEFTEGDWAHSVGGWHVVALETGTVVAHGSVVRRAIDIDGRSLRTGYVEAVATDPNRQRRGLGSRVMGEVEALIREHHEMGALSSGLHAFYETLGWERRQGLSYVRRDHDLVRAPDEDDGIMVLRFGPSARIDLSGEIACESRVGDDW